MQYSQCSNIYHNTAKTPVKYCYSLNLKCAHRLLFWTLCLQLVVLFWGDPVGFRRFSLVVFCCSLRLLWHELSGFATPFLLWWTKSSETVSWSKSFCFMLPLLLFHHINGKAINKKPRAFVGFVCTFRHCGWNASFTVTPGGNWGLVRLSIRT